MERVIDKFILTPFLSSYRVLLLQVLTSSCEIPLLLFLCFKIGGLFERATVYFPSWMILDSLLNQIVPLICFLELRDLVISSSYVDPNNISSAPVYSVALCFSTDSALFLSPTKDIRTLKCLMHKQDFIACPRSKTTWSKRYDIFNRVVGGRVVSFICNIRLFFSLLCSPNFCEGIIHKTNSLLQITQRFVLVQPNIFSLPNLKIFASAKNCQRKLKTIELASAIV